MPVNMNITVKGDFDRLMSRAGPVSGKQLPYAAARALNDCAEAARSKVTSDLPSIFDRPVPFTLKALGTIRASKETLAAAVFIKPLQSKYLLHEELGGARTPAENTRSPGAHGLIIPSKIEKDAFGNIPNGAIAALRRAIKDQASNKLGKGRQKLNYFAKEGIVYFRGSGPNGRGPGGFFIRLSGHRITRLTASVASSTYKPRFNYQKRVGEIARSSFAKALFKRWHEAIATSK